MIQHGTFLRVLDNSGAKLVLCIKVLSGYRRRYAGVGDQILISIKKTRKKRKALLKIKKGEIYSALILRTRQSFAVASGTKFSFFENGVILLTKNNKCVGTRIFGAILKRFRYTKFLKISLLASGLIK